MKARAHRLWLGRAASTAGWGVLGSVRRVWGAAVTVIAADETAARLTTASLVADEYVQMPAVRDRTFADRFLQALGRHGATAYFTTLDSEAVAVARLHEAGRWPAGVAAAIPSRFAAELCLDKHLLAQWLAQQGLPTPRTEVPAELPWDGRGIVLKPRHGWGSADVEVVETRAAFARALAGPGIDMVAQYRCLPPEITIDGFRSAEGGRVRAIARERLQTRSGVAVKARVFEDPELEALAAAVAGGIGIPGAFCIQVMRDPEAGGWSIIDVNPRAGGATAMSAAAGVDVVAAALAELFGEDPWPHVPQLAGERYVTRQYQEFVHPA